MISEQFLLAELFVAVKDERVCESKRERTYGVDYEVMNQPKTERGR